MARVHILGAGTPTPTPDRFGSAFAVEIGGESLHIGVELARPGPMEKGIGDVRKLYDGKVVFADELMAITP